MIADILPVVVFLVDWVWVIWEGILGVPFQLHLRHPGLVEPVGSPLPCVEPEANPQVKLSRAPACQNRPSPRCLGLVEGRPILR